MTEYGAPQLSQQEQNRMMSEGYFQRWNPEEQARIDRDIEANRKADAEFRLPDAAPGTEVAVEQLSHDFIFGAHIFNFDQLGTDERNRRYKELYGTLFNSATIAFYWKKFELDEGKPRFAAEYRDSADYWNSVREPKQEPHWRRPATDPVVEFCEDKKIRLHGHPLTWGNQCWHMPEWLAEKLPVHLRALYPMKNKDARDMEQFFDAFTPEQLEELLPEFTQELNHAMSNRILDIALRYKGRIHSWDVVNESATDFGLGRMVPNSGICKSTYGLMPGDYTYRSFKIADGVFPKEVKLNINDYNLTDCYPAQVDDLLRRGCKIDIMGAQMHLFNPQSCLDIAAGNSEAQSPAEVRETMARIAAAGLPVHLSEITITSPGSDLRGQAIQSVIARNLYRLWFSLKPMMGITWWNVVNDCGAPGEPSNSGLFSRDMEPQLAYFTLRDLICKEWRTSLAAKVDKDGCLRFRGFRGNYRLSWQDASGRKHSCESSLR